jgi:hypothetical protein
MPLIAYQRAHGGNDRPLHFAFFAALERRGLLARYDFALDSMRDRAYCLELKRQFPSLLLTGEVSWARRAMQGMARTIGHGYAPLGLLDRFDAACEAPGGRLNGIHTPRPLFRLYPRVRHRAILFHSIEPGGLRKPWERDAVRGCELVIARTSASAQNARAAGARHVVTSTDIVFAEPARAAPYRPGGAVALRIPDRRNAGDVPAYLGRLREALDELERCGLPVDHLLPGPPIDGEMRRRSYTRLFDMDSMYEPFAARRDFVLSSRLHTTLVALLNGNRRVLQFQVEDGTNKIAEIFGDIGLDSLVVHRRSELGREIVADFLGSRAVIPEADVDAALARARAQVDVGLDALEEWLATI